MFSPHGENATNFEHAGEKRLIVFESDEQVRQELESISAAYGSGAVKNVVTVRTDILRARAKAS